MRTKTLLIAAAALAVGVASSMAQTYSQNIVGYVNLPMGVNYSMQMVPFDANGGNALTNLIQNPGGLYDGSQVFLWNGTGYDTYTLDSGFSTGVGDAGDGFAVVGPNMPAGTPFLFSNIGALHTNTYTGTVHMGSGSVPGTSTNMIPNLANNLLAPVIPFSGGITSALQFSNTLAGVSGALDGYQIFIPTISSGGALTGFSTYTFDSGLLPSGWGDAGDGYEVPEPQIPLGTIFFFGNGTGGQVPWIQTLNP
jgi:hypothetical protein